MFDLLCGGTRVAGEDRIEQSAVTRHEDVAIRESV
jgi:hypothetical protein